MAPESLGQIRIRLDMGMGAVSANFDVGDGQARRLLESDLDTLRQSLEARGLRVDDLRVTVRPELAGPKEQPPDSGAQTAKDSPDQQASAGGAGREQSAGERADPSDSRQDAAIEPDQALPAMESWDGPLGGAECDDDGGVPIRLHLDAIA